ncbi:MULTISPECIES: 5-formyltetrahydrofolate cyclo-ligase [Gracilibacillus]|uniref:5-formyltetrahydrofolate cyclo-ligase n=1 Tax=Gracilibacillus TaxID=74385 RepID=UPI000825B5AB|nr:MULTISPECIES: 5-formyltetrahydrofolate cyclo-ligase [Gracilibacillus]
MKNLKQWQREHVMEAWKSCVDRTFITESLHRHLYLTPAWKQATTIGITISKGLEWETQPIIEMSYLLGKKIVIPRTNPLTHEMNFHYYSQGDQLEQMWQNIYEPIANLPIVEKTEIDLMIVPGIVFDKQGYRIGYGGGFYDRYLADYQGETLSLASDFQMVSQLMTEPHDQPVDQLVTNFGRIYCTHT